MTICSTCGVELEDGLEICPLCGKSPVKNDVKKDSALNYPSDVIILQRKENKKHFWELSGIIAFSGIAICTIVDLLVTKNLGWSLYSDASLVAAWIVLTLFLQTLKRPLVLIPGLMITVIALLAGLDLIGTGEKWFFPVGLPVTLAAFAGIGIVVMLYRKARLKGFNILVAAFLVLAGFCIITEMILDLHIEGKVNLRWSLISAISILPVALIFFFYHYRMKKGNRLDSIFHV
jgi:hypothetical protein